MSNPSSHLEVVSWVDSTNIQGWMTPEEVEEWAKNDAWKAQNIGWLVYEDEECMVLAARRTEDGEHYGLVERVPKQAITSREQIGSGGE